MLFQEERREGRKKEERKKTEEFHFLEEVEEGIEVEERW